jgi:soluble P-type ATPase
MIEVNIPGFRSLRLSHLVLDYNGTLALDGCLLEGVKERVDALAASLHVHVITGDTFGKAQEQLEPIDCRLVILPPEGQDVAKADYVQQLGPKQTVAIWKRP